MNVILLMVLIFALKAKGSERLEVVCPDFKEDNFNQAILMGKILPRVRESNDYYCLCSLTEQRSTKTAIIKCDFNSEKDIILKENLFSFRNFKVSSAYVRMRNAKSAIITSEFLSSWMDSPSSALDLWNCGKVTIQPTPTPQETQLFPDLKTFVGVGIVDCSLDALPSSFLRDRSRGAFRLKGCVIGKINAGLFHNIEEIRYMNFEDTVVEVVTGPLSSSGVITLSKKEIHSWDGIVFVNSTFKHLAPFSFNVTHLNEMEKFIVKRSTFGKLEKGAIKATGDINVIVKDNSFSHLDSLAIQISVNGEMAFSNNIIENFAPDSLMGLKCINDYTLDNITFYIPRGETQFKSSRFMDQCGKPEVLYVSTEKQVDRSRNTIPIAVTALVLLLLACAVGMILWARKSGSIFRYRYRRSDTPLCRDERAPDGEEDSCHQESRVSVTTENDAFSDSKIGP